MKDIVGRCFDLLFGCRHRNLSFPLSARRGRRRSAAAYMTGTYVVCLRCGKEFAYDWQEMKIVSEVATEDKGLVRAHGVLEIGPHR